MRQPKPPEIPGSPGAYLFRDSKGEVIYAGKARSLRSRVSSYFGSSVPARAEAMMAQAESVEWIVVGNEIEALQLEVSLIKQHRPRFNVRYRDDKSYPYLAVTLAEDVPRAIVMRGPKRKGSRYFGPYAHAYAIRETLDLLLKVFPIRTCNNGVFDRAKRTGRPCLLYHIGRCSAPCTGEVTHPEHREIVEGFCSFLAGDNRTVITMLRERMKQASEALEYEAAARYRDQIAAIRKVIERQEMVTERPESFDAVAFHGDHLETAFQVFFVRHGRVTGRKGFIVERVEDLSTNQLLCRFLQQLYSEDSEVPAEIVVPEMPAERETIEPWLSLQRGARVLIRVPHRGAKRRLLETVEENAAGAFAHHRLRRAADLSARSRAMDELQRFLSLPEPPLRIECFDVSNLGDAGLVGSMVVFEDGLPKKSDYRKFKMTTVKSQDDVGSMGELIHRRFRRFVDEHARPKDRGSKFSYRPSLVVIDGGKGQLNRTLEVLADLGLVGIPVISLAKREEEVFLPGETDPRMLPRGSEALYLLQRVRDEAHRFAVTYQRLLRKKSLTESSLDLLPGVGPARKRALIRRFGSAKRLREATPEDIGKVEGIGPQLARRIHETLNAGSVSSDEGRGNGDRAPT